MALRLTLKREEIMTMVLKTLLTGVAALLLATGTAHTVEIPKQYRGAWCETEWRTIY